jgi:energy-coupling factor transport system permease protein
LISRLVPVAARDSARLHEAAKLRGPGAAAVGRAAFARRLLAGSLDRSVDVAATLELRGYGLTPARAERESQGTRHDRRFWIAAVGLGAFALVARLAGAGGFDAYPRVEVSTDAATLAVAAAALIAGLAPLRRLRARRVARPNLKAVRA